MRNSGRTSIMLHRAVANALEGKKVMVVAASRAQAEQMYCRVRDMQTSSGAHPQRLLLEYNEGRLQFVVDTPTREHERGWSGEILVDHYVYEKHSF